MSDSSPQSEKPDSLGVLLMIAVPASLIVMLGIVGIAFVGSMRVEKADAAAASPGATAGGQAAAPAAAGGGAPAPAADAPEGIDPVQWALGKKSFATCAACHGPDGTGLKAGPSLMAPSLVGSETLLGDPDRPILVVLKGIQKETFDYMGVMAALGALPDDQIAAVLTYLRNNWGNKAAPVTTEQVAAARAKFSDVTPPAGVKRAEIDAIVEAHK